VAGQDEEDSDLHESLLYKFYLDHRTELSQSAHNLKTLYQGDANVYSEEQIDELLKTFKDQQDQLKTQKDIGPYYIKSMSTFKYLQQEQAVDTSRFRRIRELYQDITLENALKLLIRCKISFDNRKRLLAVFLCHGEWERQCNKLLKLLEQSGGAGKELSEEDK